MESRRTAVDQATTEVEHDLVSEVTQTLHVVAVAFESTPHPTRDLGTARVSEER